MSFSELSKDLTKSLSKEYKKSNGIFFTPPDIVTRAIILVERYSKRTFERILEPSCGSGEFLFKLAEAYPYCNITGIEFVKEIYDKIKDNPYDNIKILNKDFLKKRLKYSYDLIIGNPPYYVMKNKNIDSYYRKFFTGRPNMFVLFIIHSLLYLKTNGYLCFILPVSFLNCIYYDRIRKHIIKHTRILHIEICLSEYLETKQKTVMIILKKSGKMVIKNIRKNAKYVFDNKTYTVFNTTKNIRRLNKLIRGSTNLTELGFEASIGKIVWNQHKKILTDDVKATRLIYATDIVNHELMMKKYKNNKKKNYIEAKGNNNIILVINRGYGTGKYDFNYCIIDVDYNYLIENHLIMIEYTKDTDRNYLQKKYEDIVRSFNDSRTKSFIEIYFGNSAININELMYILPIYTNQ